MHAWIIETLKDLLIVVVLFVALVVFLNWLERFKN